MCIVQHNIFGYCFIVYWTFLACTVEKLDTIVELSIHSDFKDNIYTYISVHEDISQSQIREFAYKLYKYIFMYTRTHIRMYIHMCIGVCVVGNETKCQFQ